MQLFLKEVGLKGTMYNAFKWAPMQFQSLLVKFPSWLQQFLVAHGKTHTDVDVRAFFTSHVNTLNLRDQTW